jgi:hypothetical protein
MISKKLLVRVLMGTLVIGMAFGLVLAGCDTGGSDGAESDPAAAAQLADELNTIKAGLAKVNGATVTLTGGFTPSVDLTVPKGVTLDLTAHGAGILLRDTALTVNGTVNTAFDYGTNSSGGSWNAPSIRLEDSATWATIKGSGTIYQKGKGRLLQVEGNQNVADRTLTLDGVTLVGVEDNDQSLVVVRSGGDGRSGAFIMKSGKITGNTCSRNENWAGGGGVYIEGGRFTMESGTISGNVVKANRWSRGGGVCIQGGTFIMKGGWISGNTATVPDTGDNGGGGGVFGNKGSTFIMEGGTISGNKLTGSSEGDSGGVRVEKNAVFTLKGGTIYGKAESLPAGVDASLANSAPRQAALSLGNQDDGEGYAAVKWGTGGTYTKGGVPQTGGSDIVPHTDGQNCGTDDTLIAIPAQ